MNAISADCAYRSVFISDLHLGTRGARTDFLMDFLGSMRCEYLFLVGDIVDGWRLRKAWFWDAAHDEVLRLVLRHARLGTAVTYFPGNHDEMLRRWLPLGLEMAGVQFAAESTHVTAAGLRLLVTHGDQFDSVVANQPRSRLELAGKAEVLVGQFRPGVIGRLGLAHSPVSAVNPRLVYCSITGPAGCAAGRERREVIWRADAAHRDASRAV